IDLNKHVVESDNELESDTEDVLLEVTDPYVFIEEVSGTTWCLFHLLASIITDFAFGILHKRFQQRFVNKIYDETDFKERLHKIVWNMFMEPLKFEEKLAKLIEDFGLQNHKWMTKMFNLQEM
ncbi:hypothetical protein Tco_0982174, partial [Tanacetum coccineum]